MTVFVASLFLPYTVQFELNTNDSLALLDETSISDIFEPVNKSAADTKEERFRRRSSNGQKSTGFEDKKLSIIQSMTSMSMSQSNISLHSIDSDVDQNESNSAISNNYHTQHLGHDESANIKSIPSISSITESKAESTYRKELHHLTESAHNSHNNLQKMDSINSNSSINEVSVEDFFFNNPNISKITSNSVSDLKSPIVPLNLGSVERRLSSDNMTAYLKPKPLIRASTPLAQVNELTQRKVPQEPQLSSMRINRPHQHSNLRNYKNSSMLTLDHKHDEDVVENDDEHSNTNAFYENYTQLLSHEEKEVLKRTDHSKISPFGGFSKTHSFKDTEESIFDKAPWRIMPFEQGNGSLINSVKVARAEFGGEFKWIGTLSMPSSVLPENIKSDISSALKTSYNSNPIFLDDDVFEGHYKSFCKQILWPIFHYQIPDNPKSNAFENHSWKYYEEVNRIFAENIASQYKDGDTVWVHDYHLMLVPHMLRKLIPNAKIGFFLHVSFPSSEVFRCLAQRNTILEGILGADCVTFQNEEYLGHFLQSSNRLLLADFNSVGVNYKGKLTVVSYNPIGLDFEFLNKKINTDTVQNWKNLIEERWVNKRLIVSKDKMDQIRGLKEKLLAYERFLTHHPEFIYKTTMLLICPEGSNSDEDYIDEIYSIVERINSMTENISIDQPIVILNQEIEFDQYLALLSLADVFIVSTLREGMNLTCHEFVCASQEKRSPLIISEFVGSASVLSDGALISNPYNIMEVSQQIYKALTMSEVEKSERWNKMFQQVLKNDSKTWVHNCLMDVDNSYGYSSLSQNKNLVESLTKENYTEIIDQVSSEGKRLFVLNLDDLTAKLNIHGKTIYSLQQQLLLKTLSNLSSNANNTIYIFSSFQRAELMRLFGRNPCIGLIAESGGLVKHPNSNNWYKIMDESEKAWMSSAHDIIIAFSERIPGSYIDIEECSIVFHTESAIDIDSDYKDGLIGDLITHINELFEKDYNVHASLSKGTVIVREINLIYRALEFITGQYSDDGIIKLPFSGSNYASPVLQPTSTPQSPTFSSGQILGRTGSSASIMSNMFLSEIAFTKKDSGKSDFLSNAGDNPFEFVFTCGTTGRIDEELYTFFNGLSERAGIDADNIMTVCVGDSNTGKTCAKYSLLGINKLLTLLD